MASSATLTTTHLPQLRSLLKEWEKKMPAFKGFSTPFPPDETATPVAQAKDVVVAFRTRPPLENEASQKFKVDQESIEKAAEDAGVAVVDVPKTAFCAGTSVQSAEPGVFVAHVPGMKWSGPTLTHKIYDADLAFGPATSNDEVYQRTVIDNDVIPLVLSGGVGCILAYGQTGSGKTFTMEGLEHRIARDLFDLAKTAGKRMLDAEKGAEVPDADGSQVYEFTATFLELLGRYATDLVDPGTAVDAQGNPVRKEVAIREDKVGDVRPEVVSTKVNSSAELENLITQSLAHRRTSATLRNPTSSRSHALLSIRIKNTLLPYAEEGQLILVDLAGSERYEDSKEHDKARMTESRDNNKSLMNLKECVQAKAKMANQDGFVHIPWRSNRLTMLLKPIFDLESRQPSRTIIIAHVSPHIQDTIHSTNTLSYASPFKTGPPKLRGPAPYNAEDPRTWDHEQTVTFLTEEFRKRVRKTLKADWNVRAKAAELRGKKLKPLDNNAPVALPVNMLTLCPPGLTGRHFGKLYTTQFVEQCLKADPISEEGKAARLLAGTAGLKAMSVEIIGQLFYLVMTAKTKGRNAIMKSRQKLKEDDIYGDESQIVVPGTDRVLPNEYDPAIVSQVIMDIGQEVWHKTIHGTVEKAKEDGVWYKEAQINATRGMVDAWKARQAAKRAGGKESDRGEE